jgi:hypothetical protein
VSKVSDWFDDWATKHRARSGRTDWPTISTEAGRAYWDNVESALVRHGATLEVADEASAAVCEVPDVYPDKFLPFLVAAIKKLHSRMQSEAKGPGGLNTMDEAKAASKGCPDCEGNGIAMRYVHADYLGRFVTPVGIVCGTCPLGSLIWKLNSEAPRENRHKMAFGGRFLDLLRERKYRYQPDNWNLVDGEPMPEPSPEEVKAQVRAALMAGKGSRGSLVGRSGGRWRNAPWTSEEHRSEAYTRREEEAASGAVPIPAPEPEYPDLSDRAEMPSNPVVAADETGWY